MIRKDFYQEAINEYMNIQNLDLIPKSMVSPDSFKHESIKNIIERKIEDLSFRTLVNNKLFYIVDSRGNKKKKESIVSELKKLGAKTIVKKLNHLLMIF